MSEETIRLSHADRAIRRRRIAKAVADGHKVEDVARAEQMALGTVYEACRIAGVNVEADKQPGAPTRLYSIVGKLITTTDTIAKIADSVGCSRQRVHQILTDLRAVGVVRPQCERGDK